MGNILIASLGESPIVVTAMYDLLTKRQGLAIDKVVVLQPEGELIPLAFDLIREALQDSCEATAEPLGFDDADNEANSFSFLHMLYRLLNDAQKSGNTVYLSLAGGRKNMSALMALLVPLFPCVKGLYHVIDQDEGNRSHHFMSINAIFDLPEDKRLEYFQLADNELTRLSLVEIPYGERQQVSEAYHSLLFTITEEELDELWNKDPAQAEGVETYRRIAQEPAFTPVLKIKLTARVKEEYERMLHHNAPQASRFACCFEQMKDPHYLYEKIKGSGFSRSSYSFHFYKRRRTVERPFYHTEPQNIHLLLKGAKVDTVVISGLAIEQGDGSYKPTGKQLLQAFDPEESTVLLESILPAGPITQQSSTNETILVVPLGNRPMIATQLYTLLTSKGSNIREVVLVYPTNTTVKAGADLLAKAFADEKKGVSCVQKVMTDYADIDSTDACRAFEESLEEAIGEARQRHPGCQIELALSGGRKGMAALAMFVAQRKGIPYLYHTLISDRLLLHRIENETTFKALSSLTISRAVRNNRLFLREYEDNGPYTKFVLFKVPVLPTRG